MSEPAEDSVQRWTAKRRATLIVSILKGETSGRPPGSTGSRRPKWKTGTSASC